MRAPAPVHPFLIAAFSLALAGCGGSPPPIATEDPAPATNAAQATTAAVAPTPAPATAAVDPELMSYEVAIAIAAANRKRGESDCNTLTDSNRDSCQAGVAADWEVTRSALEDLRGDQQ